MMAKVHRPVLAMPQLLGSSPHIHFGGHGASGMPQSLSGLLPEIENDLNNILNGSYQSEESRLSYHIVAVNHRIWFPQWYGFRNELDANTGKNQVILRAIEQAKNRPEKTFYALYIIQARNVRQAGALAKTRLLRFKPSTAVFEALIQTSREYKAEIPMQFNNYVLFLYKIFQPKP